MDCSLLEPENWDLLKRRLMTDAALIPRFLLGSVSGGRHQDRSGAATGRSLWPREPSKEGGTRFRFHVSILCWALAPRVLGSEKREGVAPLVAPTPLLCSHLAPLSMLSRRSTVCAWWPRMVPFPWTATSHPCRRSAAWPPATTPWSSWTSAMPLASWGPQDGGHTWPEARGWVGNREAPRLAQADGGGRNKHFLCRGTDELLGVMDQVTIINSTLGKALGGASGTCRL